MTMFFIDSHDRRKIHLAVVVEVRRGHLRDKSAHVVIDVRLNVPFSLPNRNR